MAVRLFLPGRGALNLDAEQASLFNITLLEEGGLAQATAEEVQTSAVPRSYVDRGDVRFYDDTATYAINDYVLFNNRIWFATAEVTGVEPSASASQWTELTRENLFLNIAGNSGNDIVADLASDTLTIEGGDNVTTTTDPSTDTLTIDWSANLDDLSDVSAASPATNNVLQWNGTAWVPADVSGTGYNIISDGTNTAEASSTRTTLEITGTGPVTTAVTSDTDSGNLAISVDEATTSASGLLPAADKTLIDAVRAGGYENDDLVIAAANAQLTLSETGNTISTTSLNNVLDINNLNNIDEGLSQHGVVIFSDIPVVSADMVANQAYNVYIFTRIAQASGMDAVHRWEVNANTPTTVTDVTHRRGTSDRFRILPNTQNHFQLTWNAVDNIQDNNEVTLLAVRFQGTSVSDPTQEYFGISAGGAGALDDLSDVNVSLATQGQVLTRQADGTWTGVSPSAIEDHGGRQWNSVVNYESGDVVSFVISGNRRLFIALQDNTNQTPEAGGNTFWQEGDILRLRDIANIDITDDPANNSFLIWNQAESAWEATSALAIAGLINLGQLNDVNLTGVQEGNTLVYDVDADGNPTWNASGFTARQLLFSTDTTNVQYHQGELVYTTDDIAYPADHRDQIYRVNTTFNAPTAAVGLDPFPAGLSYLGERNDHTGVVLDTDLELNTFNEIDAINIGGTERPIRQNAKSGNALPATGTTAGDIFVLEGATIGAHTDTFMGSDGVEETDQFGDTSLVFTGTENIIEYIHESDNPVTINGIPTPEGGRDRGVYSHSFGGQTIGQPPRLLFDTPADVNDDDVITLTYHVAVPTSAAGIYYRTADNRTWIKDTSEFQHGIRLPATASTGDGFILTAVDGTNQPGYYYYTTEWVKDDTDTTYTAGTGINISDTNVISVDEEHDLLHPLSLWSATTTYNAGDQVLFDGGSNVNSIYISRTTNTNAAPVSNNIDNTTDWFLVRSGLVSVQGPADTGPAGITGNATLRLNAGTGIDVTRSGTAFTIAQHGTGHSDVDDFGPGWAFTFYDLSSSGGLGTVTGTVENSTGGFPTTDILLITSGGLPVIQGTDNTSGLTNNNLYAFVTSAGTQNQALFPDDAADTRRIVYVMAILAGGSVWNLAILNTDPRFDTRAALIAATQSSTARSISTTLTLFPLTTHHNTPSTGVPASWAQQGNTDNIPLNKLQGLDQNFTVARTATDSTEEVFTFDAGDDSSLVLLPHTVDGLTNTTITSPEADQVLTYDAANSMWINADIPQGSRFRFSTTDENSSDVEITGYITDNDLDAGTFTTVRSANFRGTGGRLQFELARYMAQLGTFADFPTAPNWDVPWSAVTTGNSITIGVNGEDDLFPNTHLQTLSTTQSNITIGGNPRNRGTGNRWTVSYTDRSLVLSNGTGLTGGDSPSFIVTATTNVDNISVNSNTGGGEIHWRSASLTTTGRDFGTRQTFLNSYPSYNWTLRTNNITSTNSCVLDFDNSTFRDAANTVVNGAGQTNSPIADASSLSIGGSGTVTFTSTGIFWNNGARLSDDDITHEFRRPAAVTGTAYTVSRISRVTEQPVFNYPLFAFTTNSSDAPLALAITNGAQHDQSTNKTSSRTLGVNGIGFDNRSGTETQYTFVAYPAAVAAPNFYTFDVTLPNGSVNQFETEIPATLKSTTSVSLQGTGAPASAAENYNWFAIEVPTGQQVTLRSVRT